MVYIESDRPALAGSSGRRSRLIALPLALVVLLAALWTGFWFYAAGATRAALTEWRTHEAALGHVYDCTKDDISGFPFRFELRCSGPSAAFSGTQPVALQAQDFQIVAQIWDPKHLTSELTGPLSIAEPGRPPAMTATWSRAQTSMRGLPTDPEQVAVVLEKAVLASAGAETLAQADHLEVQARVVSGSARDRPVVELTINLANAMAPSVGGLAAGSLDAEILGTLRGLNDLSPRPLPQILRDLQAANGRLEITRARIQQGDIVATATGMLGLSPRGALDGDLQLTIVNVDKLLAALGIDRAVSQLVPQGTFDRIAPGLDRLLPGLGSALRGGGGAGKTGVAAFGPHTELEGRSAVTLPLRFADGAVLLGPFRLKQLPPLY